MANNKLDTHLDPDLIKHFMDKAGLGSNDMTKVLEERTHQKNLEALRKKWSRIMNSGNVNSRDAELIAKELKVSVSDLQHPNLQDRKVELVELMKRAVEKMKVANDEDGLARIAKELGFKQDGSQCDWETVGDYEYAELSDKIEWLHLFGETGELESFAKLFDVTAHALRPAPLASFWLFSSSNPFCNCHSLGTLVSGHAGVLAEIKENWEALPDWVRNDPERIKATVSKEEKRYRLRFETSSTLTFSCLFYACDTTEKTGLKSINASPWEIERLMTSLKDFLFDHAGTVVIDDKQFPPKDKLTVARVHFFDVSDKGEFTEVGTRTFDDDFLFRMSLKIMLRKHEAEDWHFLITSPGIFFGCRGIQMSLYENKRERKVYVIRLGWLADDGEFHEIPWAKISRERYINGARDNLIIAMPEDEIKVIPPFEPELKVPAREGVTA